ncbi:MAG: DoxX family protein [Actinomycetales bacterium]
MSLVRLVARPLLAASFILDGVDHVRHPGTRTQAVTPMVNQLASRTSVPDDPELLVRVNGAAMAGAGTMLAIGKLPRLSSTVLAATVLPATFADYDFWAESDADRKAFKRKQFLTKLGLFGGVLLAAVDTQGQPGLAWRGERAVKDAKRAAGLAKKDARRAAADAKREARLARAQVKAALAS